MKRKWVSIPIAGSFTVSVEVEDDAGDDAAVQAAWDKIGKSVGRAEDLGELEWDYFEKLVDGNVFHANCNEIEVGDD